MNFLGKMTMALSALALSTACSNEDEVFKNGETLERGLTATIPAYQFDDGTRVNISDDLQTFTWSDGDRLGIYYQGSNSTAHAGFNITSGGESTGTFVNEAFILKPSSTYYAFYPFDKNAIISSAPIDFTGQLQTASGFTNFNYMYSTVNTDANGNASIQFKNLGSVMQLQFPVPYEGIYANIGITSDGAAFITKGTANMKDGSITATETSTSIEIFLDCVTLNAGDVLTVNILVAPVDMSNSTLTLILMDSDFNYYEATVSGKNMLQGKAYPYKVNFTEIPYVG